MKKSYLCLGLALAISLFALAQNIPHAVDSPEYDAYKHSLIGTPNQPVELNQKSSIPAFPYSAQTREGLLIPLDDTFFMALAGNDDSYTSAIELPFIFDFYGSTHTHFYINNNGNISFNNPYSTYTSTGFPIAGFPMLAAFWADVDTRPAASGKVWCRIEANRVTVIWDAVGYFSNQTDKLNTFEVIFTDGTDPLIGLGNNVAFSYGDMQWTTGSASGGSNGFGGTPATVGLNKGDGIHYALIGRFDHEGTDYYGPSGAPSGISWLDNQLFTFNTMMGTNIPPVFLGVPQNTIQIAEGSTENITISVISPIALNTVYANVLHDIPDGITYSIVPGNPCMINIEITATGSNGGVHYIELNAFDNGDPVLTSNAGFFVELTGPPEPYIHLDAQNSPYYFTSNYVVQNGQHLSIDSGVQIFFAPNTGMRVFGSMDATGVTFNASTAGGWNGILVNSSASPLVFNNCIIQHALNGLFLQNTSFEINNLTISNPDSLSVE
ncbi:MAG: hypothetical protein U1C33_03875, partial [Candidatus Cloacimonadaceae bacterium]|nr:hypothetical protein [Candidatus Cloacimonadaceae bacterium]